MDNQRVFVWAALALVLWLNYITWQRDYAPARRAPARRSADSAANGSRCRATLCRRCHPRLRLRSSSNLQPRRRRRATGRDGG